MSAERAPPGRLRRARAAVRGPLAAVLKPLRRSPIMAPACRILRATLRPPERVWRHLAFHGLIDFPVGGTRVRMRHIGAQMENSLFWAGYGGGYEGTTLLLWARLAASATTIYDVGANTGLFALAACAAAPGARVHAFEPIPAIADLLEANVALNGFDVAVHRVGVSDVDGRTLIRTSLDTHDYSASLEPLAAIDETRSAEIEIATLRLATLVARTGRPPDLVKLDIERHEPAALSGLWPALPPDHPVALLVEILDPAVATAVSDQLRGRDLIAFAIRDGIEIRREPLRHDRGVRNWLIATPRANPWIKILCARGSLSHRALLAGLPEPGR